MRKLFKRKDAKSVRKERERKKDGDEELLSSREF
jgi:hypothetical protein